MTVTLSGQPAWPDGDPGKVLLNCIISTDVDEVFEELFGSYPQTQATLHKQRNDSNCAESPWVSQRSQLPAQQFVWPAPPAGADPGTAAQGSWRKVRFDAPPSMASKAFNSEEVQRVLLLQPGSHYQVDTEVYTTAMYGDQFTVLSRYTLAAKGAGKTHLHVSYAIAFKPSLSRLMKPMVAKGVDGGIRGSFDVLKKLLQEQYGLSDLPDSVPAATPTGAAAAAAAVQAAPEAAAAAPLPAVPIAAAPAPGLLALADYVVYQDLVASIIKVSDPQLVAKALAMCLTLVLINMLLVLLRPVSQACARAGAAAAAGGGAGMMSWLCWPVAVGLDIPDSLGEVLGALLLVAVANKVLLVGVEVVATAMHGGSSPSVAASRQASVLGAALSAVAAAASSGPAAAAAAAANGHHPADAKSPPPPTTAAAAPGAGTSGNVQAAAQHLLSPRRSAPMAVPSKAGNGSAGGGSTGTGSGGGVEAALASFGTAMTGWGRNLLSAGGVVDSFSNNEGIKALVSGSWSRSSGETGKTNDAGKGPGGTSAAAARLSSAGSGPGRAASHRPSSSFSGFMDPSGLNIIEDYALQAIDSALPQLPEEQSISGSSPVTSEGGPFTAVEAGKAAAAAAAERQGSAAAAEGIRSNSPARSGSPGNGAGRSSSPSKMKRAGSSKRSLSEAEADAEARQPLLSSAASRNGSLDLSSSQAGSTPHKQGPGQGTSRPTTPVPGDDASTPPLLASSSPIVVSASRQQQQQQAMRSSKSVSFSQSPEGGTDTGSGHGPLMGSHSAAAILAGSSGLARSSGGVAGSPGSRMHNTSPLARRSASPLLYGGTSSPPEPGLGRASSSYEPLPVGSGSGYVSLVEPGQEDEDEVLVEVFEQERVQPFRGWGHTWPGHFLPSDKVGHWGDRTGAPGGATSMLFDRVAPKLPAGWTWQDQEWTVDMTGAEQEGCDAEGWAYGMDFSWLTWPPAPQSGKPGIKSFVRRRRWVRMRARLPPGAAEAAGSQQEDVLLEDEPQSEPVFVLRGGEGQQGLGSDGGPLGSRDSISNSDGGFMAGLGLGSGLGMVSHDSASAAAAAAGAMVSRFMKAVQDLPLAPRGSLTGSADGLRASPLPESESEPEPAAATGARVSMDAESSVPTGAPAAAAETAESSSGSGARAGADEQAAGVTAAEAPTSVADTQQQQQQQGPGVSSKSSNGGGSLREGRASGAVSDSDSSSVDSDSPPPRPRLSEAMAGLQTGDDVPDLSQPRFVHGAAAAGTGVDTVSTDATDAVGSRPAPAVVTAAAAAGTAAAEGPAGAQAGGEASASPALHLVGVSGAAADSEVVPEATAGASTVPADAPAAADHAAAAAETLPEAVTSPAAAAVSSVRALATAVPGDDQPQEGLPAPAAAQAATPAVSCAVEQEATGAAGAPDKPVSDDKATSSPRASISVGAGTSAAAGPPGAAAAAPVPQAAGAAPGSPAADSVPAPGRGEGALGSGDWVWSTAAAAEAEAAAAAGGFNRPGAAPSAQQSGLEEAGLSEELPMSPVTADTMPHHQQQHQQQQQGVGGVTRSGGGAAGRGVVRTGSGARGSRGRQSKLGAVPLRRSGEAASAGGAHSSSAGGAHSSSGGISAGLAGSGGSGAAEALAAAAAAATEAVPAHAASTSGSGGAGDKVTRLPQGPQPSVAVPAALAAAAAAAGAAASAAVSVGPDTVVAQQMSGDDMGSGLGWASPPDQHMPAAAVPAAVHRARGAQQQQWGAGQLQDDAQQDRKDW